MGGDCNISKLVQLSNVISTILSRTNTDLFFHTADVTLLQIFPLDNCGLYEYFNNKNWSNLAA